MLIDVDITILELLTNMTHAVSIKCSEFSEHVSLTVSWRRDNWRSCNDVHSSIRVLFQICLVPPHIHSTAETSIRRNLWLKLELLN